MTTQPIPKVDSVEHLEFKPEIPCSVEDPLGRYGWQECPNTATWWHRKHCCGHIAFICHPHVPAGPEEMRECQACGKAFYPSKGEWGRL